MTSDKYQIKENDFCVEILDNYIPMHYSTIVNRLNEQHEENQALKSSNMEYEDALGRLEEENQRLKQEVNYRKNQLNEYQQKVVGTLREQYNWLKNNDKILNHEKTVALLELKSIAVRLGVDLE